MSSQSNHNPLVRNAAGLAGLVLSAVVLAGCAEGSAFEMLRPYRMDVRQGNYVSQEMVSQLAPGMTRDRVKLIMGSPLLVDIFHQDRWDYLYLFAPGRGERQVRRVALIFEQDKLVRVEGDVVAADGKASAAVTPVPRVLEIDPPPVKP